MDTPSTSSPNLNTGATAAGQGESVADLKARVDLRDIAALDIGQGKGGTGNRPRLYFAPPWRATRRKSRSFAVYANGYKDFSGSGDTGDVIDWLKLVRGLETSEAIQWLRELVGGHVNTPSRQRTDDSTAPSEPPAAIWQRCAGDAARQTERCLYSDRDDARQTLNYLRYGRGLSDDTIRRFHLGYNPTWQKLSNDTWLAPGITIPYHVDGALWAIRVRCRVGAYADALGIAADKGHNGEELSKYLNLSGSKVNGPLFNGDTLRADLPSLFVEGEFDAMIAQQDIGEAVAVVTLGPSSSRLAARWHDRLNAAGQVYAALDDDDAGRSAADVLKAALPSTVLLQLPTGKDATEYVIDHDGDLADWWQRRADFVRVVLPANDPQSADYTKAVEAPTAAPFKPLTMRRAALFMVTREGAENYPLIELHIRAAGGTVFAAADLAESTGKSVDAAQAIIDGAVNWNAVSEFSEDLRIRYEAEHLILKNAENSPGAGRRPTCYVLTPEKALPDILKNLPDAVARLAVRGTPATIYGTEVRSADPLRTEQEAAALEAVTSEIARSDEAGEVVLDNERRDYTKARELVRLADTDETPFQPNILPSSVPELRRALWETLHATAPERDDWKHSEIMWVVGLPQKSVGGVIRQSNAVPSDVPTFKDVMLKGKNLYHEAQIACRKQGGAGVSWIDAQHNVICSLSPNAPDSAAGVKINCGKRYFKRAAAPAPETTTSTEKPAEKTPEQAAERAQQKARCATLQRLHGCLQARGWRFVAGPYAYWQRQVDKNDWETCANTWGSMIEALLEDRQWAEAQRAQRLGEVA